MFEGLSERLEEAFKKFKEKGNLIQMILKED